MTCKPFIYQLTIVLLASCGSSDKPANVDGARTEAAQQITSIQWIDSVRNFGKITEGQKLSVSFRFKNTGDKPLVIESVHPACGCTVADYPKEPIAPGKEGEITGEFNSEGRQGQQHKEIAVRTNTAEHSHNLIFDVDVVGKDQQTPAN
jgi:hypothetical protein